MHSAAAAVTKGQIISKSNFKVFIWTKKWTKIFLYFCPSFRKSLTRIFWLPLVWRKWENSFGKVRKKVCPVDCLSLFLLTSPLSLNLSLALADFLTSNYVPSKFHLGKTVISCFHPPIINFMYAVLQISPCLSRYIQFQLSATIEADQNAPLSLSSL